MMKPRRSPSTDPALLGLLEGKRALWHMIVAWPGVKRPSNAWKTRGSPARAKMIADWSRLSGAAQFEIRGAWRLLFGNGFIFPDGTVDARTDNYVRGQIVDGLPEHMRQGVRRVREADGPIEGNVGRPTAAGNERPGERDGGAAA